MNRETEPTPAANEQSAFNDTLAANLPLTPPMACGKFCLLCSTDICPTCVHNPKNRSDAAPSVPAHWETTKERIAELDKQIEDSIARLNMTGGRALPFLPPSMPHIDASADCKECQPTPGECARCSQRPVHLEQFAPIAVFPRDSAAEADRAVRDYREAQKKAEKQRAFGDALDKALPASMEKRPGEQCAICGELAPMTEQNPSFIDPNSKRANFSGWMVLFFPHPGGIAPTTTQESKKLCPRCGKRAAEYIAYMAQHPHARDGE